jgi:PAS domain S-box-containing protein
MMGMSYEETVKSISSDTAPEEAPEVPTDGSLNAILVVTPEAIVESCNGFLLSLVGRERKDVTGKHVSTLFMDAAEGAAFMQRLQNALGEKDYLKGEMTLRSAVDGQPLPLQFQASALRDSVEKRLCFVVVAQDLREIQGRQRQSVVKFAEEIPFPVLRVAEDGTLLYANNGSWLLLAHWDCEVGRMVPAAWAQKVQDVLRQDSGEEVEVQIGFKTILLVLVPVRDMRYVDFFGLDMTARKQVEKRLIIHSQVFDSATEGIVITDADRRILDENRAFTTITGYTREEILGENMAILQSGRHDAAFYENLWSSIAERGSWQGEIWDRRRDGEIHPKWLSISAVTGESGKIMRYIGLFSDISVMKQTQEQLYQMAHYDSLTGLPNRRYFHDRLQSNLEQARRAGEPLALMFMDLDGFKLINDNLGHRGGDLLLRKAADRIKECVRESDTVSRMGGEIGRAHV